jgi:hypothetical protein
VVIKDEDIPTSAIGRGSAPSIGVTAAGTVLKNRCGRLSGSRTKRPSELAWSINVNVNADVNTHANVKMETDTEIEDENVGIVGARIAMRKRMVKKGRTMGKDSSLYSLV